jgi:carboxypeptidase Taq
LVSNFEQKLASFKEYIRKIEYYGNALSLLRWDLISGTPEKGVPERAALIGLLSTESFKMSTSDEMEEYLLYFSEPDNYQKLDQITKAVIRECKRDFERFKKIPQDKYREYVELTSKAESVWEKAKNTNDFSLFSPYLEKILDYIQEFIEYWGYEGNKYNALLTHYEPGMTVERLDVIFGELRKNVLSLLSRIQNTDSNPDNPLLNQEFELEKQKEFCLYLLKEIGYDFKAGRLDESEHPFTIDINPGDVRITTHYYPDNLLSAIFSSLHEGGHGLYEQNISKDLIGTPLCTGCSMGLHESQSLFWENMIGRSYNFWSHYYGKLQDLFPEKLKSVNLDEFYRIINRVEPSLIRIEADELTYHLHIIIRYEIEKALINQEISVSDLPEVWNQKMKDYLGIEPPTDKEGVLQDVHWSNGLMGYFPSYSLGYIYAAQFYHTIRKEIPDFDELLREGKLLKIKEWLSEKIHKYGKSLEPQEIILAVTGEKSNPRYLINYLEDKYTRVYGLK